MQQALGKKSRPQPFNCITSFVTVLCLYIVFSPAVRQSLMTLWNFGQIEPCQTFSGKWERMLPTNRRLGLVKSYVLKQLGIGHGGH